MTTRSPVWTRREETDNTDFSTVRRENEQRYIRAVWVVVTRLDVHFGSDIIREAGATSMSPTTGSVTDVVKSSLLVQLARMR